MTGPTTDEPVAAEAIQAALADEATARRARAADVLDELDDMTGALDPATGRAFLERLGQLREHIGLPR